MITPRDRVLKAIRHEEPDRVPYHLSYTLPCRKKLEARLGTADLDTAVGTHLATYSTRRMAPWEEVRPGHWKDSFGVVWNRTVDPDIGVVEEHPLRERTREWSFPDPHDPCRYEKLPEFVARHPDRFRLVNHGFTLFERAWTLRGMGELLTDMLDDPEWVDELLDGIVEFNLGVIDEVTRHAIDGIMFGDDWSSQRGLIMGPRLWRRFLKPRLARMFQAVKKAGKAVFVHSCGRAQEIFPDLIEIGVDVFNPFQPEVMDPYEVKRRFGDKLAFFGGMSIQRTLPFGTTREVQAEARRLRDEVGRGGGYIIAPSHEMPGDIPVENIMAFLEVVRGS